jgi:L-alanine-DL-glutamate epimerase-like enolase superfamily enzyme
MYEGTIYYGRQGAVIQAMSGVEIALWDIVGKAVGRPVYQLLGGAFRKRLRAYASILFGRIRAFRPRSLAGVRWGKVRKVTWRWYGQLATGLALAAS